MLEVEQTNRWCNACLEEHGNYVIRFGLNEDQTSSFSLCESCRNELIDVLSEIKGTET